MTFEEWFDRNKQTLYEDDKWIAKKAWDARQAEIDELQETVNDQLIRIGQLEERIEKLIPLLERYNYAGWIKILKGNQNEN